MMEIFDLASCGVSPHRDFRFRLHESMVTKSMKTYPGRRWEEDGLGRA